MANVHRTKISLRFWGDDLHPDEISAILGVQPTRGVAKGDLQMMPNGTERTATTGRWNYSLPEQIDGDLDQQLTTLLSILHNDVSGCRALAERFNGNIFVGLFLSDFNEGLTLSPATLSALGSCRLALDLDIYSSGDF